MRPYRHFSEVTIIDRQKYVAELGKLLSGMARADREAVLRGVNARFDEAGDDDAVIAALGSPTFAAVSVLRGYTPPENLDEEDYPEEEEYQYVEPAGAPAPDEGVNAAPEAASSEPDEASPGQTPPEAEEAPLEAAPEEPAAGDGTVYGPAEDAAEEPDIQAGSAAEEPADAESEEPAQQAGENEAFNAAPEAEPGEPDEALPGQVPPEPDEAPIEDEAAAEEQQITEDYGGAVRETVDIGFDTIEVYSDASSQPEPDMPEPEAAEYEPGADEAFEEAAEPELPEEQEAFREPQPEPEIEYNPPIEADKPKLRGGRVFVSVLLGIIPGIPLAVVLIVLALAILAVGAALVYAGGVFISFAFLGMSVVADILLTVGFGMIVAAIGLPVAFLAVWFFLRCVVGLYSRMFAKAGAWCRGEERGA